jgi:heme/copper-type cytochrome/quinol oxidase subunit 2
MLYIFAGPIFTEWYWSFYFWQFILIPVIVLFLIFTYARRHYKDNKDTDKIPFSESTTVEKPIKEDASGVRLAILVLIFITCCFATIARFTSN